jgi:hypothetical protein
VRSVRAIAVLGGLYVLWQSMRSVRALAVLFDLYVLRQYCAICTCFCVSPHQDNLGVFLQMSHLLQPAHHPHTPPIEAYGRAGIAQEGALGQEISPSHYHVVTAQPSDFC